MKRVALLLIIILTIGCLEQPVSPASSITKVVLENGMTVILKENRANDIVAIELFVKTGAWNEDESNHGIRNFVQRMLLKGTETRSAEEIAFETEGMGIELSTSAGVDYTEISMKMTKEYFDEGLDILSDITMNSIFDPEEVEKERNFIIENIKAREDDMFENTHKLFLETLYGNHPYGSTALGEEETVKTLDRERLVRFYNTYYTPNNMVLAIVGNMDAEKAISMVKEAFNGFEPKPVPKVPEVKVKINETYASERKEREQTFIIMGYLGDRIKGEDYATLKVINSILGVGMSSRLFVELRDKQGLAYAVGSFYPSTKYESYIVAYIGTSPDNIQAVEEGILAEFEKLKGGITEDELEIAKRKVIGRFRIRHESNKDQAWYLAWYEALGAGYEYDEGYVEAIEKVTVEDVARVANTYFETPVIAVVGPD